ncbi:hypothetical protein TNCV_396521 [Trichonephila clavipes]|nr:hypothetical protein TNCV_396521 [Trichonephila clavipes]
MGSRVVRTSDSRPEGLVPCLNCGGGDRGGVAFYRVRSRCLKRLANFIPSLREGHDNDKNHFIVKIYLLYSQMTYVKSTEAQRPPAGVIWKFEEGAPSQVFSSSRDNGSEL